jgi:hypothetical protein
MEEQTKRMALLSVAALVVVGLVFAAIFYFTSRKALVLTPTAPTAENQVPAVVPVEKTEPLQKLSAPVSDSKEAQLKRFCIDFVARFGTNSTDGNSANLTQLMPLMSGELKTWAAERLANQTAPDKFSGVTTKALAAKIISQSANDAVVQVSTQRTYTENGQQRVAYEDATVTLSDSAGWRAEAVTWKARAE